MTGALALLAGVLLGLMSSQTPGCGWRVGAMLLMAVWVVWGARPYPGWPARAGRCAVLLLVGQWLAGAHVEDWQQRVLTPGPRVLAEGCIDSVPERAGELLIFDLLTARLSGVPAAQAPGLPRRLRVHWRLPAFEPRVGERWQLLLKLEPLEDTRNFSGPDLARTAFREDVHGRAQVIEARLNQPLLLAPASLDTLRARLAARVRDSIADPDAAALVSALAVGLTADISRDQWRVFNATGTTHLVAISGLHVTLFAWLAFRLARQVWRLTRAGGWVNREPFALLLGLGAAGGYSLLAGLSVPTLRTWLMLALYVGARLLSRRVSPGRLWSVALMLVLFLDARAPLSAGFWLSFIAVGVLLAFAGETGSCDALPLRWWSACRTQFIIMLALVPASLAIFGGVSWVGLAVNLVAIPLISLLLVPLVLAGALCAWLAPSLDALLFGAAAGLYHALWPGLVWCADGSLLWRSSPGVVWFLLAAPAVLVALCPWPWSLRVTACCAALPLLFPSQRLPPPGAAHVTVLDAGRGAAVLVRTRSHTLLFDTGDGWNTRGARLTQRVLPALAAAGIPRVDRLVLPVLDEDRARAAAILRLAQGAAGSDPDLFYPCADRQWLWDAVRFESFAVGRYCLLRISVGSAALLLPGELDANGERALVARLAPGRLASPVALISRQVSERASTPQWIESVKPGLVIAAGGVDGAQSRRRTLARWRARGGRVLDLPHVGAVQLRLDAQGARVVARARDHRFPFPWRRVGSANADCQRPRYDPEPCGKS